MSPSFWIIILIKGGSPAVVVHLIVLLTLMSMVEPGVGEVTLKAVPRGMQMYQMRDRKCMFNEDLGFGCMCFDERDDCEGMILQKGIPQIT